MRFPGWFAILVGAAMAVQWSVSLLSGGVPELQTEPIALGFHLAAEAITAAVLIVSGAASLRGRDWAKPMLLSGLGMLVYTSIMSPGYFAQRGEMRFLAMFTVIFAAACISIAQVTGAWLQAS